MYKISKQLCNLAFNEKLVYDNKKSARVLHIKTYCLGFKNSEFRIQRGSVSSCPPHLIFFLAFSSNN